MYRGGGGGTCSVHDCVIAWSYNMSNVFLYLRILPYAAIIIIVLSYTLVIEGSGCLVYVRAYNNSVYFICILP